MPSNIRPLVQPPMAFRFEAPTPDGPQVAQPPSKFLSYQRGMDYGVGVDTPSGSAMGAAATGSPSIVPGTGETLDYSLVVISSEEELQTALGISASASGSTGLFSASARADFAQKCSLNSSSVFAMICIQITESFQSIKSPGIDPAAAALLANGNEDRFLQQYGDCFVRGFQTGGAFFGSIEIQTHDKSDAESLKVAVQGSYAAFSASASFSQEMQDSVKNRGLNVKVHIEGGTLPNTLFTSLDGLTTGAGAWIPTVKNQAVPYSVLVDSYKVLPLPSPPNFVDLQHQLDVITQCAAWRNMDMQTLNDIAYIRSNPEQFTDLNMDQLSQDQSNILDDLNTIATAASTAIDNPKAANFPTTKLKIIPPLVLPSRVQTLTITIPNWRHISDITSDPLAVALNVLITYLPTLEKFHNNGLIASISPAAGTVVKRGATVNVSVYSLSVPTRPA